MTDQHYPKEAIESHHLRKQEIAEALHISSGRRSQIRNGTTRTSKEHEAQLLELLLSRVRGYWTDIVVERVKRFGRSVIQLLFKEKQVFEV